jgi:hypothetical protein
VPPHSPWLQTLPLHSGGVWGCHASRGSGPHLTIQEGSGVAMCSMASDPVSSFGRAPVPPCVLGLPDGAMNKEIPRHNGRAARLARYQGTPT